MQCKNTGLERRQGATIPRPQFTAEPRRAAVVNVMSLRMTAATFRLRFIVNHCLFLHSLKMRKASITVSQKYATYDLS